MEYPNVTLKITNSLPTIELHNEDQTVREIFVADMSLNEFVHEIEEILDLHTDNVWDLATNGDDQLVDFSDLDLGDEELNLADVLAIVADKAGSYEELPGLNEEVAAELWRNWQSDILASAIEGAYNLLISKVIIYADTLGIIDIRLDDDRLEPRLREKMSIELAKFDTQLIVD